MGKVSFDIRWFDALQRGSFSDATKPFEMHFVRTKGHISWSGQTGDDTFHTTDGEQTIGYAQIAREKNGFFFGEGDDD